MEKISDGGSFAEKFRIRSHPEFHLAAPGVCRKRPVELEPRARGHRALFDHEFGRARLGSDLSRYVVNGGKVRLAGIFWRRAHADEDGIAGTDRFTGVRRVRNPPGLVSRRENLLEMLLVDGHPACIELGDALPVNVGANHFVSRFRKTGSRDQTYVSTADD